MLVDINGATPKTTGGSVRKFAFLIALFIFASPQANAATCNDVLDGNIGSNDPSLTPERRHFAFIVASKRLARGLLDSLEQDGARNGFDTVLDVYANDLVPFRDVVERSWLRAVDESGGPLELLAELCTNRDDRIFNVYMRTYDLMYIEAKQ